MKGKPYLYGLVCGTLLSGITTMMVSSLSGKKRKESIRNAVNNIKNPMMELKNSTIAVSKSLKNVKNQAITYVPSIISSIGDSVEQYSFAIKENQENIQHHLEEIEKLTSTLQ